MWFGCWQQPWLALAARQGRAWWGSWHGFPGTGWTDGPLLISALSLKMCKQTTTLTPAAPAWVDVFPRISARVIQPFHTSLSVVKSSSSRTRELNKNEREWESTAQSRLYLLFNTSPSCGCQRRERYITYFSISLTVPSFLQQIKVFSWRVRNLSLVYYFKLAARALKQEDLFDHIRKFNQRERDVL